MWTVVYMAQNKEMAEKLKAILEAEGILVKLNPVSQKEKTTTILKYQFRKVKWKKPTA